MMYVEELPVNPDKSRKPQKQRANVARHVTRRKRRKGAAVGIVQEVYQKKGKK
jgi:hypothetical protein